MGLEYESTVGWVLGLHVPALDYYIPGNPQTPLSTSGVSPHPQGDECVKDILEKQLFEFSS